MHKNWTPDFETIIRARPEGQILAVCLHPALDVTIYTDGGVEIGRTETIGGKAINLARMLHALGAPVTLLAPDDKDGETGALLKDCPFDCHLIPTSLTLRKNYKYIDTDGTHREDNGNAGTLSPQDCAQLFHSLIDTCRKLCRGECRGKKVLHIALCGSFPQGVEKDVYKSLTEQLKALDITCTVDASGEALSLAVQANPLLIKPNLEEFCTAFAQDISMLKTQNNAQNAIASFYADTGVQILCSMDKRGAIYAGKEGVFAVQSPEVRQVRSFAGAGDTMLASFLYARVLCQAPIEHALRFACASATAKVRLPAGIFPLPEQIYAEYQQTTQRKVGA